MHYLEILNSLKFKNFSSPPTMVGHLVVTKFIKCPAFTVSKVGMFLRELRNAFLKAKCFDYLFTLIAGKTWRLTSAIDMFH